MENIKGIFRLHLIDTRTSYLMFWSIFTVVSLALIVLFHNAAREGNLHIGIGIAVIIYLGVHALISIKETLPYAIGLGYTRRQYALASILFLTLLAVFTAAFQHIYVLIVEGIASQIGVGGELFLSYENFFPQGVEYLWASSFLLDLSAVIFIVSLTSCLAIIFYRFGKLTLYSLAGITFFILMFFTIQPHLFFNLLDTLAFISWNTLLVIVFLSLAVILFTIFYLITLRIEMLAFRK